MGGESITIPIDIQGFSTVAVIDTAAQVTVISTELAQQCKLVLKGMEQVRLRGAAKEGHMLANYIPNLKIKMGKGVYRWGCMSHQY